MINLRNRISTTQRQGIATPSQVNASIDEVEAMFNKIAVSRGKFVEPVADYFRFDASENKLYLDTIEGKTFEVTITEV